jgi:hypothetical protein
MPLPPPTALDDLGYAVDGDNALQVVALLAAVAATAATAVVTTTTAVAVAPLVTAVRGRGPAGVCLLGHHGFLPL